MGAGTGKCIHERLKDNQISSHRQGVTPSEAAVIERLAGCTLCFSGSKNLLGLIEAIHPSRKDRIISWSKNYVKSGIRLQNL